MKVFIRTALMGLLCFSIVVSCSTPEEAVSMFTCEDEALFSRTEAKGTVIYLACYDAWAIVMDETNDAGDVLIAATTEMPDNFRIVGIEVVFDACFYEFDLPLLLPDPVIFGELYVIQDFEIEAGD